METLVTNDGKTFYWYLISEYNNHVLAQGTARSEGMALKKAQGAQIEFLVSMGRADAEDNSSWSL